MNAPLSDQTAGKIREHIRAGQKIEAIKLFREETGLGLKESKDAVEAMEAAMRSGGGDLDAPGSVADPAKASYKVQKGCLGILMTGLALVAVAAGFLIP